VLFFEDNRDIFKNAVSELAQVILPLGDTFEFDAWVDLTQGGR